MILKKQIKRKGFIELKKSKNLIKNCVNRYRTFKFYNNRNIKLTS